MKKEKNKMLIAWIILIALIIITIILTYIKYFSTDNTNIEERPINESSSNAIHIALKDIITNFNENSKVKEYGLENNLTLKAVVNNYSIFISYINDTTTTYEFKYEDLFLNITINNIEEDKNKFNIVYKFLIEAVQKRINNTNDISELIDNFLTNDINYDGLIKEENSNTIKYQINITKKLENGGSD